MLSLTIVKLVILLFLGSLALVRKAQNEFYTGTEQNHLRGLFPFLGGNAGHGRDGVDNGNILKVIDILQNNIKQWSFVESQLMEPNVNLGMPEIFIPLKHLTTTLEILGNIFFVQDDLAAAKESLERACPLMELLPESVQADDDFMASAEDVLGAGGVAVDPAELSSFLWFGGGRNANGLAQPINPNTDGNRGAASSGYAAGCFSLLRDVYVRLYGTAGDEAEKAAAVDPLLGEQPAAATSYAASVDALTRSKYNNNADKNTGGTDSASGVSSTSGPRSLQYPSQSSYRLPDGRPRELNLKYVLSRPQQMQQMKQKRPAERNKRNVSSEEEALLDQLKGGARSAKVTGTRMSMAATTTGSAYKEKSAASQAAQMADQRAHHSDSNERHESVFDVEQKLRELRTPYQHLRSEMAGAHSVGAMDTQQAPEHARSRDSVPRNSERRGVGLGLSGDSAAAGKPGETAVRGFDGSALNTISGAEITLQGVATSIIADDLEVLLRKFVRATRKGRRDLAKLAAKYFDELDINFPNMDYNEYAANMDVGQAYLEVMARVVDEGFGFIAPELDTAWARISVEDREEQSDEDAAGTPKPSASTASSSRAALSSKRLGGVGAGEADEAIIASLEKDWGLTFRSAENDGGGAKATKDSNAPSLSSNAAKKKKKKKKTSEASVPKLTMAEKNRLLVLYAFDIVHSDPSDLFDLGLGFTQGIFDNDRTRRGGSPIAAAPVPGDVVHEAVDYLRNALKGGLLGGTDDAHQRLFPFDSLSSSSLAEEAAYDQRQIKRLTEQHLRDLLVGEGGAEAYLAAKSAAIRKKSSNAGGPSAEGTAKSNSRRRRQQRSSAGEGEYSVSSEGGSIGVPQRRTRDTAESEGDDDLFDETAGATIGILSASSLRASVPSLGQDGGDWTLSIFLLFMMLTAAVVYTANQEAARKRMATGRNRLRHGGNALGGGGKKASGAWAGGSSIVDFMYAQLGGVSGAPGANATADWDDSVPASVGAGAGSEADATASLAQQPNAPAPNSLFVSASSSLNVFLGGLNRTSGPDASATGAAAQGGSTKPSGAGGSKTKRGKDSASQQDAVSAAAASATASKGGPNTSSSEAGKNATRASLFGDLLSLMKPTPSTSVTGTVDATTAPVGSATPSSSSVPVSKIEGAQKRKEGAGAEAAKPAGNGKGKAKKGNQKESSKPVSPPSSAATANTNSTSNAAGVSKSVPSSESLNSVSSTSSSDSKGSSNEAAQFLPPVVMNNRRVSWGGLLPTSTTTESALDFEEGYEGDWAAAKKKGGRKHANTAAATTDGETGAIASKAAQKDSASHRSPSKPPQARLTASISSATGAANSAKQLSTARSFAGQPSSSTVTLSARSKSTPAPVPTSVAAAGTAHSAPSAGPPDRTDSAAHSAPTKEQKLHDLSETRLLTDQLDRWTLSALSPVTAAPTRPPVYAPPGLSASPQPSPKSTGFPVGGPGAALSLQSPSRTNADQSTSLLHGGFGFSQFDLGPSSSTYTAASSLWSSVGNRLSLGSNTLGDNVPLSSQTSMADEGYAVDFESDGYLGDLVSFLDSSPRASPQLQPRSLDNSALTATYGIRDSSAYTYGAAGVYGEAPYGMAEEGYYADQTATMDSYYQQQGQYAASADGHYGYYSEVGESTSLWGMRQQQRDSGGHDLAASITLEASSVYGLSPDAPSFRPSTQRRIEGLQPLSFPAPSGVDFRNHLLGGNNGALFPTGASLASSQSPSTSGLFNSEEFYESILIDSILGGEDQKKQGSVTELNKF